MDARPRSREAANPAPSAKAPPLEAGASSSDADADAATSGKKRELPAGGVPQPRGGRGSATGWDSTVGEWVPDDAGPVAVTHNPEERAERRQKRVSKQAEKLAAANASLAAGGVDGLKGHEAKALLRAAGQRLGGDKQDAQSAMEGVLAGAGAEPADYGRRRGGGRGGRRRRRRGAHELGRGGRPRARGLRDGGRRIRTDRSEPRCRRQRSNRPAPPSRSSPPA